MKKIEEQFKKDFEQSKKVELSFDTTQLDADTRKIRHKSKNLRIAIASFSGAFALLATAFVALIISSLATSTDEPKLTTRKYTQAEIKIAESNTFRKLNEVKYPKGSKPLTSDITVEDNLKDPNSLYHFAQKLIKFRLNSLDLKENDFEINENDRVIIVKRKDYSLVINLSNKDVVLNNVVISSNGSKTLKNSDSAVIKNA